MSLLSHSDLNSLVNPTGTSIGTGAASLLDRKFELKLKNFCATWTRETSRLKQRVLVGS